MDYISRLRNAPPRSIHELTPDKAKRLGGKTMVIPSPDDVEQCIKAVPFGCTITFKELGASLASRCGTEIACPFATRQLSKWLAWDAEERQRTDLPWWRVTDKRKVWRQFPGGGIVQQEKLKLEGIELVS